MLKENLRIGADYAFREKRIPGSPLSRIVLVQFIRGKKWKARWMDTHAGLIDYISSDQILVPWKESKLFLQEERDLENLRQHNREADFSLSPIDKALHEIFENAGDEISYDNGILRRNFDALNRLRARCQLSEYKLKFPAFQCRDGTLKLPYDEAVSLGRNFCMSDPAPILSVLESTERKWAMDARRPGNEYTIPLLNNTVQPGQSYGSGVVWMPLWQSEIGGLRMLKG